MKSTKKPQPVLNIDDRDQADKAVKRFRTLKREIAAKELATEEQIAKRRESMKQYVDPRKSEMKSIKLGLEEWFNANKPKDGAKCIHMQNGTIGKKQVPHVEVSESKVDEVPPRALTIIRKINKRKLQACGESVMQKVGAKVVRSNRFYIRTADEDGGK